MAHVEYFVAVPLIESYAYDKDQNGNQISPYPPTNGEVSNCQKQRVHEISGGARERGSQRREGEQIEEKEPTAPQEFNEQRYRQKVEEHIGLIVIKEFYVCNGRKRESAGQAHIESDRRGRPHQRQIY